MKIEKRYIWLFVLLFIVVVLFYFFYGVVAYTSNAYLRANWVEISPRIDGYVENISVENNSFVRKNTPLFSLDKYPYEMQKEQVQAELEEAEAQIKYIDSTILSLEKQISVLIEEFKVMEIEKKRFEDLSNLKAESMQKYQTILLAYYEVKKNLEDMQGTLEENIDLKNKENKTIKKLKAQLALAEYRWQHTVIRAPFDGYLTNMYLMKGQFLHQGEPVFGIAQSQKSWVEANFKECWVGKIKPGQRVWIMSDLYPFRLLKGKVVSITSAVNRTDTPEKILPYIKPTIDWVRLQYRFTAIIKLDNVPEDMHLRMGADARVLVWL